MVDFLHIWSHGDEVYVWYTYCKGFVLRQVIEMSMRVFSSQQFHSKDGCVKKQSLEKVKMPPYNRTRGIDEGYESDHSRRKFYPLLCRKFTASLRLVKSSPFQRMSRFLSSTVLHVLFDCGSYVRVN